MKVVFTARRLKPGAYDAFRKAWEPDEWPPDMQRGYILRHPSDPDQVVAFGLFDITDERMHELGDELKASEQARHDRMAPHVAETLVSGVYEVAHAQQGPRGGSGKPFVPLTVRRLESWHFDAWLEEWRTMGEAAPEGMQQALVMRNIENPDEVIAFGIFRGSMDELRAKHGDMMAEAQRKQTPHIREIPLDTTYDLVEELTPAHV